MSFTNGDYSMLQEKFIRPSNTGQKKVSCESELQCSLCGKRLQRGRVLSVYGEV